MEYLDKIGQAVRDRFRVHRRVLSYSEYLDLLKRDPGRHTRDAARYVRDMFDHYGATLVRDPDGEVRRFNLFDAPWDNGERSLIGEESVQNAIYRVLHNFVRQGRVDRFILLHGPNGSSKSTITELIARALEHYSTLDEGAIYCFNWIFPSQKVGRSGIGFAGGDEQTESGETFAHLEDEAIDARLACEMHDHPLLLVPLDHRQALLEELRRDVKTNDRGASFVSDYIDKGALCHKCKLVYEALLNSYQGDFLRVLRHVQVERFFISRRYRRASTRVEPQFAVDAKARQVTADRSLSALPTALQSINLFELDGDLVQANRGVIDYPDLLKRPIEAYKYLLTTVEDGRVVLDQTNLYFDMIFIGSSNEMHLNAFMDSPEWMSFKGRMELVSVPYLRDYRRERLIYEHQIKEAQVGKHIAPHAIVAAALWAVLTRMHKPTPDRYKDPLKAVVAKLTPLDKVELYATGKVPREVKGEGAKLLRAAIPKLWRETYSEILYEGRTGASPREVRTAIMNAAQDAKFECLTPGAILAQFRELVQETTVYAFLRMEADDGYYDHEGFIDVVEGWYLERADHDIRAATGLVEEASYQDLFNRYMTHVTHFVRKEKIRNQVTGSFEDPDTKLMAEVEKELRVEGDASEFRRALMTKIGAWSVDHKGEKPDYPTIFPDHFERLSSSYFQRQRQRVVRILHDALLVLSEEDAGLGDDRKRQAEQTLNRLKAEFGYCEHCAREALTLLVRTRYAE